MILVAGFLKNRRKKDSRKKSVKAKDDNETENKDIGSDGEERGRSETPTPENNEEEGGYKQQPSSSLANDPWADFNQPAKKSFYSSSDSDSDDDEVKKIRINIRPVESGAGAGRSATSASVDELQKAVVGLDLNVATLPVNTSSHFIYTSFSIAILLTDQRPIKVCYERCNWLWEPNFEAEGSRS